MAQESDTATQTIDNMRQIKENELNWPNENEFFITKTSITKFYYDSGPMAGGYALLRFTNVDTGEYCTHAIQQAGERNMIKCNISYGKYKATLVGGSTGKIDIFWE